MKKIYKLLIILPLLIIYTGLWAQVPNAVKYQAISRDAIGNAQANQAIVVVFQIHEMSPSGEVVFEEKHETTTNKYGMFSLNIGDGSGNTSLDEITWGQGDYFLEVAVDGVSMGTSQLLSVPYAFYAGDAAKLGGASAQEWDKSIMSLLDNINDLRKEMNAPKDTISMKSSDGSIWSVWVDDEGNIHTKKGSFMITYEVYLTYPGMPIEVFTARAGELVTVPCSPLGLWGSNYEVYAKAKGYYTDLMNSNLCEYKAELDTVVKDKVCGVVFRLQSFGDSYYASNTTIAYKNVASATQEYTTFTTNDKGQFSIDIEPGTYTFSYESFTIDKPEDITVEVKDYIDLDFYVENPIQVLKPNIYLYPKHTQQTQVILSFPQEGWVDVSEPEYGTGWDVSIEPDGTIDDEFTFLFYESTQPDKFQYAKGWGVAQSELQSFFTANMQELKFNNQEIKDFIDYWIPRLNDKPYYAIFPQFNAEIDPLIDLSISPKPDVVNRLFYVVKGVDVKPQGLETPEMPSNQRTGFTVMEWGVILK